MKFKQCRANKTTTMSGKKFTELLNNDDQVKVVKYGLQNKISP